MPQTIYEVLWIFIVYAVIGWCSEVAYAALDTGKFVNRGFLNGPYCPIYGFGISLVIVVLTPLKENLLILYIGSVILTSVIEYITGYLLEKVFHNKWWDYSDKPYNIKGYICLKFSLFWGFACTFIVLILHPIIYGIIKIVSFLIGVIILTVVLVFFAIDCGITVATIMKFNERLKRMNEIAQRIHHLSDEVGENIYENVTEALEKKEKFEEEHPARCARGGLYGHLHFPVAGGGLHPHPVHGRRGGTPVPRVLRGAGHGRAGLHGGLPDHHAHDVRHVAAAFR